MHSILRNKRILLCGIFPELKCEVDFEKYKEARGLYIEDPWERVKTIFTKDDYGNWHPEMLGAIKMAQYGALTGSVYGLVTDSLIETQNFMRTNDTNIFSNKNEAYKNLNNRTLLAGVKGSLRSAPAFALFFGSYSFIASCCELYRNKIDILDNIVAGATVGALYRFMFGIKGMLSGAIIGSLLGTIYGTAIWGMSKLTKTDRLEIKYAQFAYSYYKKQKKPDETPENEQDKKILDSKLHDLHVPDPLNLLEEKEENVSKKQDK